MSVEVMRSVIEAAEGRVPVDTLFTNAQIVDVYGPVSYTHLTLPTKA